MADNSSGGGKTTNQEIDELEWRVGKVSVNSPLPDQGVCA